MNLTEDGGLDYTSFNMTFNMANVSYGSVTYGCPTCSKSAVSATPTWTIDEDSATTNMSTNISTLNYEATTTMFKLLNPPDYSKAW